MLKHGVGELGLLSHVLRHITEVGKRPVEAQLNRFSTGLGSECIPKEWHMRCKTYFKILEESSGYHLCFFELES